MRGAAELLKESRGIIFQIETNISIYDALVNTKSIFYTYRQGTTKSNMKHWNYYKIVVKSIEHLGRPIFADNALTSYKKKQVVNDPVVAIEYDNRLKKCDG